MVISVARGINYYLGVINFVIIGPGGCESEKEKKACIPLEGYNDHGDIETEWSRLVYLKVFKQSVTMLGQVMRAEKCQKDNIRICKKIKYHPATLYRELRREPHRRWVNRKLQHHVEKTRRKDIQYIP